MSDKGAPQQAVGGQAVIEGVMMRTPSGASVAVRKPDGAIVVRHKPWESWTKRWRPLGWPFMRGVIVLVESLVGGMDALKFSAEEAAEGETSRGASAASSTFLLAPLGLVAGAPEGAKPPSRSASFAANVALVAGLAVALILFKGVPHVVALLTGFEPTEPLFHVVDGVVKLGLVIGYITAISRMKDIQRVFEYHGAEHKSIRTFELGLDLTVDNARAQSRLHPRCGTSFIVVVVAASVLVYIALSPLIPFFLDNGWRSQVILVFAKIVLLAPVSALAYEFNRLAGKHWQRDWAKVVAWPGMVMQRLLTTREPSDDQLEVGLVALRSALDLKASEEGQTAKAWRVETFESFDDFNRGGADQPEAA